MFRALRSWQAMFRSVFISNIEVKMATADLLKLLKSLEYALNKAEIYVFTYKQVQIFHNLFTVHDVLGILPTAMENTLNFSSFLRCFLLLNRWTWTQQVIVKLGLQKTVAVMPALNALIKNQL